MADPKPRITHRHDGMVVRIGECGYGPFKSFAHIKEYWVAMMTNWEAVQVSKWIQKRYG